MGRTAAWLAALVLVAAMNGGAWAKASASASAPDPSNDPCFDVVATNLSACLEYVDPTSKTTPASNSDCCKGMGDFLRLSPQCICYLLNTNLTDVLELDIDRGKALNLPNVCKKKLPLSELSKCSGNASSGAANSKCLEPVAEKLIPCVDYVDPASNKTKPPSNGGCCSGLKTFLKEDFDCLCSLVNAKPGDFPISIDRTKVLQLPGFCNATIPSFRCSGNTTLSAPENKCLTPVVSKLASCIEYVDPASNKTKPAAKGGCCSGLKTFLKEDFDCLCSLVNAKPGDFPISIDRTKVLQLPGFCNTTIPSFRCSGNTTLSAPENKCLTPVVSKLASCIEYVDPASNKTKPAAKGECCGGLEGFLKDEFSCICSLINLKPGDYPVPIDRVKVLSLPGACNATIPSIKCSGDVTSNAPENPCLMPVVQNLASCVDYVDPAVNKSEGPVSGECCDGLRSFVENQPRCICPIVDGKTDEYPIPIDRKKASGLVSSCKVPFELVSPCFESDSPAGTPPGAPAGGAQPGFTPSATALLAGATLVIAAAFF